MKHTIAAILFLAACGGGGGPAAPSARGTVLSDAPDLAARLTSESRLRGLADEYASLLGDDPLATLRRAVVVHPNGAPRTLEIDVSLPDPAVADEICDELQLSATIYGDIGEKCARVK